MEAARSGDRFSWNCRAESETSALRGSISEAGKRRLVLNISKCAVP